MLNSRQFSESETVLEFQQNLDNCIGESGKIKHLMDEALSVQCESIEMIVSTFYFESRDLSAFFQACRGRGSLILNSRDRRQSSLEF